MTNTIVILAAGMSSRMKKSTDSSIGSAKADEANTKSKSLIKFGNKPFIYFLLENIVDAGFQNAIMGLIAGGKTTGPVLRRSYETGKETDTIFWR